MTLPLAGLRVLDFSRALTGPYCTQMLGDMGADIIKIEQPEIGDNSRAWGPPFEGGESSYYLSVNRNKRSMALNLRHAESAEVVRRLVAQCDIIIENFVPGTLDRNGFGYEACSGAASAVRSRECLVQIKMYYVKTYISRTAFAEYSVKIRPVIIH